MEVKNEKLFLILTVALVSAMVFLVVLFSQHPMGADFTMYDEITPQDMESLESLEGRRVVVRGTARILREDELFTIQNQDKIIGWIRKRFDPTQGRFGHTSYEDFKTSDFAIAAGDARIAVKGQPEQVIDSQHRIDSVQDPNIYWDIIKEGEEYSVFGTLQAEATGEVFIFPYRVTNLPISDIKEQASSANRRVTFIQYFSIFALVLIYAIAMWKGNIFGPATDEDETGDETPQENDKPSSDSSDEEDIPTGEEEDDR